LLNPKVSKAPEAATLLPVNDATTLQAWTPGEPWRRFLATLLDIVVFLPMALLVLLATGLSIQWQNSAPLTAANVLWWFTTLYLIVRFQGTPGKRLMGLRIFRTDGRRPGWMEAINRQILFIGLSSFSILQQGALLSYIPPGTTMEAYPSLLAEHPTTWAWVGDAGLALLWASCLLILMRPDRRALYDLWSGTVVVRQLKTKPVVVA